MKKARLINFKVLLGFEDIYLSILLIIGLYSEIQAAIWMTLTF